MAEALSVVFIYQNESPISVLAYLAAVSLTVIAIVLLALVHELWGLGVLSVLVLARLLNTCVIRSDANPVGTAKRNLESKVTS